MQRSIRWLVTFSRPCPQEGAWICVEFHLGSLSDAHIRQLCFLEVCGYVHFVRNDRDYVAANAQIVADMHGLFAYGSVKGCIDTREFAMKLGCRKGGRLCCDLCVQKAFLPPQNFQLSSLLLDSSSRRLRGCMRLKVGCVGLLKPLFRTRLTKVLLPLVFEPRLFDGRKCGIMLGRCSDDCRSLQRFLVREVRTR